MTTGAGYHPCPYCGGGHTEPCPNVKAIEYYQDGSIKRVEFRELAIAPPLGFTMMPSAPGYVTSLAGNDLHKPKSS